MLGEEWGGPRKNGAVPVGAVWTWERDGGRERGSRAGETTKLT